MKRNIGIALIILSVLAAIPTGSAFVLAGIFGWVCDCIPTPVYEFSARITSALMLLCVLMLGYLGVILCLNVNKREIKDLVNKIIIVFITMLTFLIISEVTN